MINKTTALFFTILFAPLIWSMERPYNEDERHNDPTSAFYEFPMSNFHKNNIPKKVKEKRKKQESDEYAQYYDEVPTVDKSTVNVELIFNLLSQIKNKEHKDKLKTQFCILLATNSHLTDNILSLIGNTGSGSTKNQHEASKEVPLALTFKHNLSKNPINLVGDIPRHITRLIETLNHPELYHPGSVTGFNLLLIGEPGTGKSSIAQLIAQRTERDFYKVSSSSLITSFQGSGANAIKSLFTYIREQEKSAVVFIDEIDGIANDTAKDNNEEARRTVYELHNQLDQTNSQILCVLATNHLDKIPSALKSRFNIIKIEMPSYKKRLQILHYYAQNSNIDSNLLRKIAMETEGLSCRDLEKLSKEALLIAREEILTCKQNSSFPAEIPKSKTSNLDPRNKGKCKEDAQEERANSKITVNERHYSVAIYVTQNFKLPNEHMRMVLFGYFNEQDHPLNEEMLDYASKEAEGFSAQDIEEAVQNAYALCSERGFEQPNDLDLLAGIYYKQKNKLADTSTRCKLFRYFLDKYPNTIDMNTCNLLASHTVDDFTGEEIKRIVERAHNLAEIKHSQEIEDIDICVALHYEIRKKEKPYKTIYSTNKAPLGLSVGSTIPLPRVNIPLSLNHCVSITEGTEESIPLTEQNEFYSESIRGASYNKSTRKDFRTRINPNLRIRSYLLLYFMTQARHSLTLEQIKELIYKTEGFSWYSIEQLIKDAKDQSADNRWELNGSSFFRIANKYNLPLSDLFNNRYLQADSTLVRLDVRLIRKISEIWDNSTVNDEATIATIFNQNNPVQPDLKAKLNETKTSVRQSEDKSEGEGESLEANNLSHSPIQSEKPHRPTNNQATTNTESNTPIPAKRSGWCILT